MPENAGFGRRLREARKDWEKNEDRELSFEAIGIEVGRILERDRPYSQQAVSRWFAGSEPEMFSVVAALGMILGVSPGWLAFGDELEPPSERIGGGGENRQTGTGG